MPSCNLLDGGVDKTCDNNVGGITELYLTEKSNITDTTLSSPGDKIEDFEVNNGSGPQTAFYKFEFNKNTSTFVEATVTSQENGSEVCTQTITLVLTRREKTKRDTLLLLGKFKDLVAIIKDSNGLYWYFGETAGLNLTEKTGGPGTAKTDRNGYELTFVGEEPEEANEVTEAAVLAAIVA